MSEWIGMQTCVAHTASETASEALSSSGVDAAYTLERT